MAYPWVSGPNREITHVDMFDRGIGVQRNFLALVEIVLYVVAFATWSPPAGGQRYFLSLGVLQKESHSSLFIF